MRHRRHLFAAQAMHAPELVNCGPILAADGSSRARRVRSALGESGKEREEKRRGGRRRGEGGEEEGRNSANKVWRFNHVEERTQ